MLYSTDRAELTDVVAQAFPPRLAQALEPLIWPCAGLRPGAGAGGTWIGGAPRVPDGFVWPRSTAPRPGARGLLAALTGGLGRLIGGEAAPSADGESYPLAFLLQIDLAEVCDEVRAALNLPEAGALALFHDLGSGWGPGAERRKATRLFHFTGPLAPRAPPQDLPAKARFAGTPAAVEGGWILPCLDFTPPEGVAVSQAEREAFADHEWDARLEKRLSPPAIRLGGWPMSIQNDVALETEMDVSGREVWPDTPQAQDSLTRAAGRWRLLLEVGSGPAGFNWGDGGTLYAMLSEADLKARRWEGVWLTGQCY